MLAICKHESLQAIIVPGPGAASPKQSTLPALTNPAQEAVAADRSPSKCPEPARLSGQPPNPAEQAAAVRTRSPSPKPAPTPPEPRSPEGEGENEPHSPSAKRPGSTPHPEEMEVKKEVGSSNACCIGVLHSSLHACSMYEPCQVQSMSSAIRVTTKDLARFDATLRRLCNPSKKRGVCRASPEIVKQWQKSGAARKDLLGILIEAAGDKASNLNLRELVS